MITESIHLTQSNLPELFVNCLSLPFLFDLITAHIYHREIMPKLEKPSMKTFHYLNQTWTIIRQDRLRVDAKDQLGDRYILFKSRIPEFAQ